MSELDDSHWFPSDEDRKSMRLMMEIGRSYNDFYLQNYGKELGVMLERLSLAIIRLENKYDLFKKDKHNFLRLKDKLKHKIDEIVKPRFKPGDLVKYVFDENVSPCMIVGMPHIDEISRKPVQEVLMNGSVRKVSLSRLSPVSRQRKVNPSEAPSQP